MKTTHVLLAALLAGAFSPALAEDAPPQVQAFRFDSSIANPHAGTMVMRTSLVRDAPYSALAVTEKVQALADGNQIAERQSTMIYRDGAGRTRREVRDAKGETMLVTINDPVAHANLVLRPRTRTATRIADLALGARTTAGKARAAADKGRADVESARLAAETAATEADAARVSVVQARKDGDMANVERRRFEDGTEAIIVKRVARTDGTVNQRVQDVRIQVPQALAGALANGMFADAKWAAKATTRDLGTRDIGGVRAEGKLRSYEIPAGEIGNSRAIVVSDETWTSPELKVAVYTKHSDPRSGDVIFRLESIRRDEPAAALFAVPADYTVQEPLGRSKDKVQ